MLAPEQAFEQLKAKILKYNPQADLWLVEKAFSLAVVAHSSQQRISGEPYVMHPLAVADILADMELDCGSITAGLLHDTVEDTIYSTEDIREMFGDEIALLVDGVTKLSKIPYSTKEEQQIESIRKMFLAMAKDIRVILIKLADRLHNMRTLKSMPEAKQREKARETMEIYAPLAHRLGMQKIKWELEDLSLRYLDPIAYHEIAEGIDQKRAEREEYLKKVQDILRAKLDSMNIKSHIEGRAKHFYSIYRKMYTNNIDLDQMYDLLAVRVIVDTIPECYEVLGLVHELFKPIPGRFKDYIAMPKKNMYQSLHTSLIGPGGKPFEVQIRTWEMHRVAEVGIAAHWKYKEGVSGESDIDSKLEWVRQLIDIHKDMSDAEEFMHTLKIDLFEDEVFVFSPKGDVINLPANSTPIDFAYAIHSAIGNKTVGAKINGKIVPLDYKLVNGDIVEIITSAVPHGPSRDWLKTVKTSQARKKINEWFKKEHREENIIHGKEIVEREFKRSGLPLSMLKDHEITDGIFKKYNFTTVDDLYAIIGFGGLPVAKVITRFKEEHNKRTDTAVPAEMLGDIPAKPPKTTDSGIVVKGVDNCLVKLSRCCNPVPGDEIVGYVTRGRGVSVHRKDCVNVKNMENEESQDGARFIEVSWGASDSSKYVSTIQIIADDKPGLFVEAANIVSNLKMTLQAINGKVLKEGLASITVTVEVTDKGDIDKLIKNFRKISGVTSVVRTKS